MTLALLECPCRPDRPTLLRAALVATAVLLLAGCGDPAAKLVGTWTQFEGNRPETRLILRDDGTGKLEVPGGVNYQLDEWLVESDRHLRFRIFDQDVLVRFVRNDDLLELSRVEAFDAVNGTYRRQGG